MTNEKRNEISYYSEIMNFVEAQIKSNFKANYGQDLYVFCKMGELSSGLKEIVLENSELCECVRPFSENVPPLNLDIFALITNGTKFELLILEIKKRLSVGLNEWSQLVGYCIVSNTRFGLLINVDGGASKRLVDLLNTDSDISNISRIKSGKESKHLLGFMEWDGDTKNLIYSNAGEIKSISKLCNLIWERFNK